MASVDNRATVNLEIVLTITESEARALDALVGYGVEPFLKTFYEHMGQSYMKPHEKGIRTLFESIGKYVRPHLNRAEEAREVFHGKKKTFEVHSLDT